MVWILFIGIILVILGLDLGVFNKTPHIITTKEATLWTLIWVSVSLLFSVVIYGLYNAGVLENPNHLQPLAASMKYVTGYLIELSLSADNIFVMAIIFTAFKIPQKYQHRILFWGILGALIFRGLMIYFGVVLIHKFSWTSYVFGAFLLFTAIKMLFKKEEDVFDPKHSFVFKIIGKIIPISSEHQKGNFFMRLENKTKATPLFVALLIIEVMDVLFALDSVPAILAISSDPFIVFTSNIFAILGLRSMYFFLANMLEKFSFLEYSLIAILSFVGMKMILKNYLNIPEWISLAFIAVSLLIGVLVSITISDNNNKKEA